MESQACPHLLWNVESPPPFFSRITFISGIAFLLCKCKDLSSNPGNSQKLSPRPCMPAMAHMHTMHTRTSNKLKTNKCKIKIKKEREKSPLERNSREGKQASVWVINLGWLCLFLSSVPWTFGDCFYLSLGWVGQAGFPSKMARPRWIKQEQGVARSEENSVWCQMVRVSQPSKPMEKMPQRLNILTQWDLGDLHMRFPCGRLSYSQHSPLGSMLFLGGCPLGQESRGTSSYTPFKFAMSLKLP